MTFDPKAARDRFSPEELKPSTGDVTNALSAADVGRARSVYRAIYIRSPSHRRMHKAFDRLRALGVATRGQPQRAIRNSALSGSGKTAGAIAYANHVNAAASAETITVLHVTLDRATTVRRLWAAVNEKTGDEYSDQGSEDMLRRRAFKLLDKWKVQLLMIDEAQHLGYRASARNDVTDSIKKALDDGIVPIALLGNEQLAPLLSANVQLTNRMEPPCDLKALDINVRQDRLEFAEFVRRLDEALVNRQLLSDPSQLTDPRALRCLYVISSGVMGRVVNLVEQALVHALERNAARIEPYDLMVATDRWAVAQGLVSYNPFRSGAKP